MSDDWLNTVGVKAERISMTAGISHVPASPYHRLGLHIGMPVNASCRCDDKRHVRVQSHGDIDIVPAGLDGEWEDDGDCSILRLWLSPALLRQTAEDLDIDPARVELIPQFQRRDASIEHIALALETHSGTGAQSDRLFAESLGKALAVHLIGSRLCPAPIPAKQMLSSSQRRRLTDFIESHLEQDLSLKHLATVAGISASHLKLLFRHSFGMPVHQYVIRCRVERAKRLILSGEIPLSQVALMSGFAHQSHMAHMMKRILGLTPGGLSRMRQ
jgi:AraC family transcriptional regulator